jgi:quercetin dioxygenase-like cupin family protein
VTRIVRMEATRPFEAVPGVVTHAIVGEAAMLNVSRLAPGAVIALHSHPHEQVGYVTEGSVMLTAEGVERALEPGDAYQIPGGGEHALRAGPGGAQVIDTFHPVREDYREAPGGER